MSHATWRSQEPKAPAGEPRRSITGPTLDGPPLTAWSLVLRKWFVHLGRKAEFSYWQWYEGVRRKPSRSRQNGPIAQLDRVADFYSAGCRFESCWDRQVSSSLSFSIYPPSIQTLCGRGFPYRQHGRSLAINRRSAVGNLTRRLSQGLDLPPPAADFMVDLRALTAQSASAPSK